MSSETTQQFFYCASRGYRLDLVENTVLVSIYGHYLATAIVNRAVT
jgi:hypothetical protein